MESDERERESTKWKLKKGKKNASARVRITYETIHIAIRWKREKSESRDFSIQPQYNSQTAETRRLLSLPRLEHLFATGPVDRAVTNSRSALKISRTFLNSLKTESYKQRKRPVDVKSSDEIPTIFHQITRKIAENETRSHAVDGIFYGIRNRRGRGQVIQYANVPEESAPKIFSY